MGCKKRLDRIPVALKGLNRLDGFSTDPDRRDAVGDRNPYLDMAEMIGLQGDANHGFSLAMTAARPGIQGQQDLLSRGWRPGPFCGAAARRAGP